MKLSPQQIEEIVMRGRDGMRPRDIARVMKVCNRAAAQVLRYRNIPRPSFKTQIVALHRAEPDLTTRQIAARLGCSTWTVCRIAKVCLLDIPIPPPVTRPARQATDKLLALGRAARGAGLTVSAINAMGARRAAKAQGARQ